MNAADLTAEQFDAEREWRAYPADALEREFWNRPLREAIRAGRMEPLPWIMADEAGRQRPSLQGCCLLCGFQTRETKDGLCFCLACEAPREREAAA